jgi:hypothetical protein
MKPTNYCIQYLHDNQESPFYYPFEQNTRLFIAHRLKLLPHHILNDGLFKTQQGIKIRQVRPGDLYPIKEVRSK